MLLLATSCITQIQQYERSVSGVIPAFAATGIVFASLQLSLTRDSHIGKAAASAYAISPSHRWASKYPIIVNITMIGTNTLMLFAQIGHGVTVNQPTTYAALAAWISAFAVVRLKMGGFRSPRARLYSSLGIRMIPQLMQGISFAVVGAQGFSVVSLGLLLTQVFMKLLLSYPARRDDAFARAAYLVAAWDFAAIVYIAACWTLGCTTA